VKYNTLIVNETLVDNTHKVCTNSTFSLNHDTNCFIQWCLHDNKYKATIIDCPYRVQGGGSVLIVKDNFSNVECVLTNTVSLPVKNIYIKPIFLFVFVVVTATVFTYCSFSISVKHLEHEKITLV
jgi:hypothetical protein